MRRVLGRLRIRRRKLERDGELEIARVLVRAAAEQPGDGKVLAGYLSAYPAMIKSVFDAVADTTGIDIPSFIRKLMTGNLAGSATDILSANIMGGTCARVCPTVTRINNNQDLGDFILIFNKEDIFKGLLYSGRHGDTRRLDKFLLSHRARPNR